MSKLLFTDPTDPRDRTLRCPSILEAKSFCFLYALRWPHVRYCAVQQLSHCHEVSKRPFGQYCVILLDPSDTNSISGTYLLVRSGYIACATPVPRPECTIHITGLRSYLSQLGVCWDGQAQDDGSRNYVPGIKRQPVHYARIKAHQPCVELGRPASDRSNRPIG